MNRPFRHIGIPGALVAAACLAACGRGPSEAPASSGGRGASAPGAVPQIAREAQPGRPVLFVGLDGADWQLLDTYIARGVMPNLAQLVREGTSGMVETIRPPLSPIIWTTMMTGVSPLDHGILDFVQFDPRSGAKEPITSSGRRAPAVWNMATYGGKRVATLGLWATYPAEPVNGVVVSDRLFTFLFKERAPPAGVVYPADLDGWARQALDRAERIVDEAALRTYLPWLSSDEYRRYADSDAPYAHPISALRRILVETQVYDQLARETLQRDRADLTIVYLQGTDTIGHVFAPFAPPRQPSVSMADYERYSQVPERYFRAIDERLGEYRRLAALSQSVLMLASDHGFFWSDGRPAAVSSYATTTAAQWHRDAGMYLLWGPGVSASPAHDGRGSVQQVCATLLALLGLPPGRDVEGDPLPGVSALTTPRADYFAFYQPSAPQSSGATSAVDQDTLAKLRSLGYLGGGGTQGPATGSIRTPGSYNNEGVILKERGKITQASDAFEKALQLDPDLASALWNLSDLLFARQSDLDRSDALLVRAFGHGLPEGRRYLIGRAIGYSRAGQTDRSVTLVDGALQAQPDDAELWLFRGRYRVDAGDCAGALADFVNAERLAPAHAPAYASEGLARLCTGDRRGARSAFARSLQLDPNQPKVRDFVKSLEKTP